MMSFFNRLKIKKWPSRPQWGQFLKVLTKKEKILFFLFSFLAFFSFSFLLVNFYFDQTKVVPAAGGKYIEGVVGFPRFINPIYAPSNDVDRDLTELLFAGLMKYNQEGEIVPDLTNCQIKNEGKIYDCFLKKGGLWHDGKEITPEDIIFTVKIIQDPEYNSPLRINWLEIETEKISKNGVRFKLKNPYPGFLENLTLKILPKHIWENISPENFPLVKQNLQPIGSGPYQFKELKKDKVGRPISITLIANSEYFGSKPKISQISFKFFENEEKLILAFQKKEIDGLSISYPKYYEKFETRRDGIFQNISLPRYFAVFFNQEKSKVLAEKEVRIALNYGTNKQEILEKVFHNLGKVVNSPILPEIYGFSLPETIYQYDLEKAKEILKTAGFKETKEGKREKIIKKAPEFEFKNDLRVGSKGKEVEELQKCLAKDPKIYPEGEITGFFGNLTKKAVIKFQEKYSEEILEPWGFKKGTGIVSKTTRKKLNEICFEAPLEILPLSIKLTTVDQPFLKETANLLKKQWEKLGVEVEIETFDIDTLEREILKPRNYQALLFGQILGKIPDPFPFWHSSQKRDPGLNLASYENEKVDKLLEKGKITTDFEKRAEIYEKFQNILLEDAPAIFLLQPDYVYFLPSKIKGTNLTLIVDPSKRFSEIENWYIKTKRVWR